jgi:hypothetical protein
MTLPFYVITFSFHSSVPFKIKLFIHDIEIHMLTHVQMKNHGATHKENKILHHNTWL